MTKDADAVQRSEKAKGPGYIAGALIFAAVLWKEFCGRNGFSEEKPPI